MFIIVKEWIVNQLDSGTLPYVWKQTQSSDDQRVWHVTVWWHQMATYVLRHAALWSVNELVPSTGSLYPFQTSRTQPASSAKGFFHKQWTSSVCKPISKLIKKPEYKAQTPQNMSLSISKARSRVRSLARSRSLSLFLSLSLFSSPCANYFHSTINKAAEWISANQRRGCVQVDRCCSPSQLCSSRTFSSGTKSPQTCLNAPSAKRKFTLVRFV